MSFSPRKKALCFARGLIGIVFFFNIQCALVFIIQPNLFLSSFELSGESGLAMLRGVGVLFIMWNVPYALALWHPSRYRVSLIEATLMQGIGVFGETMIYLWLNSTATSGTMTQSTLPRFIVFDGFGLTLLLVAGWFSRKASQSKGE